VGQNAITGTLDITSEDHGGSFNLSYAFYLTMHTSENIDVTVSEILLPELMTITLTTDPLPSFSGSLTLNNVRRPIPYTYTSIVGIEYEVFAPGVIISDGGVYSFDSWPGQPSGVQTYLFHAAPAVPTITAGYTYTGPATIIWLPLVPNQPQAVQR
jgi:hypothetical protein